MHTGAFRGPGKTPAKRTLPYSTSDKIPTKHTVRIPRRPKCAREPFGVLGKLTQIDHSLKTTSPKHRKTHGQDARTLTVHTGAFWGPGKTHTNRSLSYNAKPKSSQNTRSGCQDADSAHGSLSGSWENSHKSITL